MTAKSFNSIFAAEIQIDVANYIVENLFKNKLESWNKPLPRCPFWRKEYREEYKQFAKLSDTYSLELSAIQDLLKVFDASTISSVITSNKLTTIRFLKKEQKALLLYELFNKQIKMMKQIESSTVETEIKDITKIAKSVRSNKMMKL